jgi:chemotaxis regulatin CheY-phosphate phosphatase CheZ
MKAYNYYETVGIGKVKSWKGKSGIIEVIKQPDRIILVRMRKSDINEEPKRVEIVITKQEVNAMITALNLNRENQPIKTSQLAMDYSKILGLGHTDWERFFADRINHNKITTLLSYMDEEKLISYSRRGTTKILSDKLEVQMLL